MVPGSWLTKEQKGGEDGNLTETYRKVEEIE
jgi:hypothetical protein